MSLKNHANIISSISHTCNSLSCVLDHCLRDVCLLGRGASTDTNNGSFTGNFEVEGFKFWVFHAVANSVTVDHEARVEDLSVYFLQF